jgi:hypothetical protein
MPLDVTLTFLTSAEATAALAPGITVRRCEFLSAATPGQTIDLSAATARRPTTPM